jgi:2-C-methyl-D-erythritol 4-phosphate cytidylyltransferase/2-C-methyl-D-erythritol 2,4-cyclodiphosphate synthase
MNNYFIILASGQSKRFNSNKPKQFITYKNKALFEHSLDKAIISKLFKKIVLVVNDKKQIKKKYSKNVLIIKGGKERSDSSLIALKYIKKFKPNNVLIHDAARPNFTINLLKNLIKSLKTTKHLFLLFHQKTQLNIKLRTNYLILREKILT